MPLILAIVMPIALGIFWLVTTSRAATETPNYKVIRTDGAFEIRDYPALTLATTPMDDGEMNRGFGQLFRFITGSNAEAEKIAMTSPVLIDTANDKKTMSFIMPKKTVEKGVPKPAGDSVSLGKVEAARFAVLRFGGGRTAKNEQDGHRETQGLAERAEDRGKRRPCSPTTIRRGRPSSCAATK